MKKRVIDASTLLAYLQGERGAADAGEYCKSAMMSAVNLTEVFQKSIERQGLAIVQAIVHQANIEIVPYGAEQAALVAELYLATKGKGVSLADRACLALGRSCQLPVVTGDHAWEGLELGVELVFFRPKSN